MEAHRRAEHGTAPFVLDTPSNAARREREELDSSDPEQVEIIMILFSFLHLFIHRHCNGIDSRVMYCGRPK